MLTSGRRSRPAEHEPHSPSRADAGLCPVDLFGAWWQLTGALGAVPAVLVWDGEGAVGRWRAGKGGDRGLRTGRPDHRRPAGNAGAAAGRPCNGLAVLGAAGPRSLRPAGRQRLLGAPGRDREPDKNHRPAGPALDSHHRRSPVKTASSSTRCYDSKAMAVFHLYRETTAPRGALLKATLKLPGTRLSAPARRRHPATIGDPTSADHHPHLSPERPSRSDPKARWFECLSLRAGKLSYFSSGRSRFELDSPGSSCASLPRLTGGRVSGADVSPAQPAVRHQ
jgi:hypothetical protein